MVMFDPHNLCLVLELELELELELALVLMMLVSPELMHPQTQHSPWLQRMKSLP